MRDCGKRYTIFDIERRKDFAKSFATFFEDLNKTPVETDLGNGVKMLGYLDHCIRYWPY